MMHSTARCATCKLHHMHCKAPQWSASLPNVSAMHRNAPQHTVVLSVCLSARIRHRGKTAEWIGTRLGTVVRVGLCIGIIDFGGDRRREGAGLGVSLRHCMVVKGKFDGWLCGSGCGTVTKWLSGSGCRWKWWLGWGLVLAC